MGRTRVVSTDTIIKAGMIEENEIYACAVLMCLDDLSENYQTKKAHLENKYPQKPERVKRALNRLAYQVPEGEWIFENESDQIVFLKDFLAVNKQSEVFDAIIWEKGLEWGVVVDLFEKNKGSVSREERKSLYRSKIAEFVKLAGVNESSFDLELEEFCTKASFLSNEMRFDYHKKHCDFGSQKDVLVFSDKKLYSDLSHLFFYWDSEFQSLDVKKSYVGNVPSIDLLKNKKNLLINLLQVGLKNSDYEFLADFFKYSFPDQSFSMSRKNEVLLLNYLLKHSRFDANCCVLLGGAFLNRLGVDQFFRKHLLSSKRVKTVIALPDVLYPKMLGGVCLMVLGGQQNKVSFIDAREAYLKKEGLSVLDLKGLAELWKTTSVSQIAVSISDIEKQESRLDPSVYLSVNENDALVQWSDLVRMERRIKQLSDALKQQLEHRTLEEKPEKVQSAQSLMNQLILGNVSSFQSLPLTELKELSILILKTLPKLSELEFSEFLDDAMYAVSDRFALELDFDQIDALSKSILKKKIQFKSQ